MASFEEAAIGRIGFTITRTSSTAIPFIIGATGTTVAEDGTTEIRTVTIGKVTLTTENQEKLDGLVKLLEGLLKTEAGIS